MNLRKQAVGSVKWTSASTVITAALQLIQVAVLTRFLDKKDFGLMAMAIFVIGISRIFIDMGISNAIIHKQQINKDQLSSLFWLNIVMGTGIYLFIILLSPFVARLYDTDALRGVIDWTAVSFLVLPWGQQFEALLRKDLKFKSLSIRDVVAKSTGFIVAVLLAYWGFGVYALVYANLTAAFISVVLLMFLGFKYYRPRLFFSYKSLKRQGFFSFGLYQMGEQLINYFNTNFDTLLIGKILGMEALGLYNIAKVLALKPYQILNPVITKVAFPVFAKIQNEITRLKRVYLKVVNLIASLNAPVYILMIIFAKQLVLIAFGRNWVEAVPILQLLAIGTLCRSIGNPIGSLQLGRGRADLGFYWNLGVFIIVPGVIWIGSFFGLLGVALALAFYRLIVIHFPSWYFLIRPLCYATYKEYILSFWSPFSVALLAGIIPFMFSMMEMNSLLKLVVGGAIYIICYIALNLFFKSPVVFEFQELVQSQLLSRIKYKLKKF